MAFFPKMILIAKFMRVETRPEGLDGRLTESFSSEPEKVLEKKLHWSPEDRLLYV